MNTDSVWMCPYCGRVRRFTPTELARHGTPTCDKVESRHDVNMWHIPVVTHEEMVEHVKEYIESLDTDSFLALYRDCFPNRKPKPIGDFGYEISDV